MRRLRTKPLAQNKWLHQVRQMTATAKGPLEPGFGDGRLDEADQILYFAQSYEELEQQKRRRVTSARQQIGHLGQVTREGS